MTTVFLWMEPHQQRKGRPILLLTFVMLHHRLYSNGLHIPALKNYPSTRLCLSCQPTAAHFSSEKHKQKSSPSSLGWHEGYRVYQQARLSQNGTFRLLATRSPTLGRGCLKKTVECIELVRWGCDLVLRRCSVVIVSDVVKDRLSKPPLSD